jgi:hypothetical protein
MLRPSDAILWRHIEKDLTKKMVWEAQNSALLSINAFYSSRATITSEICQSFSSLMDKMVIEVAQIKA